MKTKQFLSLPAIIFTLVFTTILTSCDWTNSDWEKLGDALADFDAPPYMGPIYWTPGYPVDHWITGSVESYFYNENDTTLIADSVLSLNFSIYLQIRGNAETGIIQSPLYQFIQVESFDSGKMELSYQIGDTIPFDTLDVIFMLWAETPGFEPLDTTFSEPFLNINSLDSVNLDPIRLDHYLKKLE